MELDEACAEAVELAREAAVQRAGVLEVGPHRGVLADDVRVVTHLFECVHPGYPGWQWSVTVARASRARVVTISEVTLVPGEGALLAPSWVPWADRIGPKDLTAGVLAPAASDDYRLEPGFTGGEFAVDEDPAEASQTRAVVAELGLGRERVESCGFFVGLSGSMGRVFGVCANELSPSDGEVVSRDHGCGGHSDVVAPTKGVDLGIPVWDTISVDEGLFD
jgi:hypothetical protein